MIIYHNSLEAAQPPGVGAKAHEAGPIGAYSNRIVQNPKRWLSRAQKILMYVLNLCVIGKKKILTNR